MLSQASAPAGSFLKPFWFWKFCKGLRVAKTQGEMLFAVARAFFISAITGNAAPQTQIPAIATFLQDDVPFGDLLSGSIRQSQRQGFAVNPESLTQVELMLDPIPSDVTLKSDGMEVVDLADFLEANGVHPENAAVDQHEIRMGVGRAMLSFLEQRFGREIIHLADTSRVSGGAIYGEATVRDTGSETLRNAHHVIHVDKEWTGISRLTGENGTQGGVRATVRAQWPLAEEDFTSRGYDFEDYVRLVHAQDPGMVNLWVSLTPGELRQHPMAFLLNSAKAESAFSSAPDLNDVASTMHSQIQNLSKIQWENFKSFLSFSLLQSLNCIYIYIYTYLLISPCIYVCVLYIYRYVYTYSLVFGEQRNFNDTITVLREKITSKQTARWGVVPEMTFGQALLFLACHLVNNGDSKRKSNSNMNLKNTCLLGL